jgi:hypothetical protein
MATDILLSNCRWVEPDQIRNFALQFLTLDGNWILLRPFSCSKGELKTLSDAVAAIPPLKYEDFSISAIKTLVRNNKLHLTSSVDVPNSMRSWEEFGAASQDLNQFFQELRSTKIDPITSARCKIPTKLQEVAGMRIKVNRALFEDTITFESVSLLQSDLSELYKAW